MRFPEFKGEWTSYTLGNEALFLKGNGISKEDISSSKEGIPCILYGEMYTDYAEVSVIKKPILKAKICPTNTVYSKSGDVIIPASGETHFDISNSATVLEDNIALGGDINVIRLKKSINGNFLALWFRGKGKKIISSLAQGDSVVHLSNQNLKKISIYFPTYVEQSKISHLLNLLDLKIALQRKTIEDLEKVSKTTINLLTKDGDKYKFKDIYLKAKEGGTPDTKNSQFYIRGTIPFVKIKDLDFKYLKTTSSFINDSGLRNSSAWLIPENSIILSNGATIGKVSINCLPVSSKQGILGIIPNPKVILTEYLYYLIRSQCFQKSIRRITTKGTMDAAYIGDIDNIDIYVPTLAVQGKKIQLLSKIDAKIDNENRKMTLLGKLKDYLIANLFV